MKILELLRGTSANSKGHQEAKLAAQKFDDDEIHVLKKTWQDLADRSNGKGIDKETFLQYFPLNGLLGERLYAQFDVKRTGYIDFDEFITGLATVCRGTMDDKIHFVFNMYDVSHDNTVSKQELSTLLNHIPKEAFKSSQQHTPNNRPLSQVSSHTSLVRMGSLNGANMHHDIASDSDRGSVNGDANGNNMTTIDYEDNLDHYTNQEMVDQAFNECDLNHEGRLTYEEFKMWIMRNPTILDYIESILPYNGPKDSSNHHHHRKDTLPHVKRIASQFMQGRSNSIVEAAGDIFHHNNNHTRERRSMSRSTNNLTLAINSNGNSHRNSLSGIHTPNDFLSPVILSPTNHNMNNFNNNANNTNNNNVSTANTPAANDNNNRVSTPTPMNNNNSNINNVNNVNNNNNHNSMNLGNNRNSMSSVAGVAMLDNNNTNNNNNVYDRERALFNIHSPSVAESNVDHEELAKQYLLSALECTRSPELRLAINQLVDTHFEGLIQLDRGLSSEVFRTVVTMESFLWKKGKSMFHMLSRRYYLLSGNCMYYYGGKNDVRPKGVVFLTGSIVEKIKDEEMQLKGFYGFEITHQDLCTGEHHRHEKRVLYCKSEEEREKWVFNLQHAAHVVPIEDDYVIGKELGRGRFSVVCECVHKFTGMHCAVKIIDKQTIEPEEKALLRTEIAVLKLVNHPNIIKMLGLYESKQYIYIVMEMLKGGELFERIVGRPRFTELEAARLLKPLLESVAYLHDLGIVHRDLKPENILCGDELEDLKIADFGLSKMILPKEKMDAACGTLSYVAPEVLTMQGYGKEADLWSVGVILFLLLCGKLPFDGDDHNEIIRSTIQGDLKVNPTVWARLSEEGKNLITSLLNKNSKERITARDALKHAFLVSNLGIKRTVSLNNYGEHNVTSPTANGNGNGNGNTNGTTSHAANNGNVQQNLLNTSPVNISSMQPANNNNRSSSPMIQRLNSVQQDQPVSMDVTDK